MNCKSLTNRFGNAIARLTLFLVISTNAQSIVIHESFSQNFGTGGASNALAVAGARDAYSEALASCESRTIFCGATANANSSTDYLVQIGASSAFYGATGLSVGGTLHIPIQVEYYVAASGSGTASARIHGVTHSVTREEKTGTENFFMTPGSSFQVSLYTFASATAGNTGLLFAESYASADPIVSISSNWEYAAFSDLITIEEFLDPVSLTESGVRPDGYFPHLPENSALLSAIIPTLVPIPATVWLFGFGIIGLIGFTRRKVHQY